MYRKKQHIKNKRICLDFILPLPTILTLNRRVMKLNNMIQCFISNTLLLLFLFSCGSETVKIVPATTPLLIETKAQVKNSTESNNVKIDIALSPNKAIRLEVTGTLGYRVATVLITPQKIQYALHVNHTYGEGQFSARTMYPIFKQNLDPRIIWRVIHNQNPQAHDLLCQVDEKQRPLSCKGSNDLAMTWAYDEPPRRRIEIKIAQFEMNWLFKDQRVLNDSQTETFVLKKPEGYKEILLK
jgi:hypothetical protein